MKKIGIFAGVFDPIHLGHTYFIDHSIKKHSLDKVYILVEREPKYKTCLASYEHRKAMAGLAIEDIPRAEIYEPSSKFFPVSASLPEISKANPNSKLFLLLGDDVAKHINEWPDSEKLLKDVELVIAVRGSDEPYSKVSSLKVRKKIETGGEPEVSPEVLDYCGANQLY